MQSDTYFIQAKEYASELRLGAIKSDLEESISDAENNNLSYEEFLCRLLQKESDIRKYNLTQSRIKTASPHFSNTFLVIPLLYSDIN